MIEKLYLECSKLSSDCREHLPLLRVYAEQCKHVTEIGFRDGFSATALLVSKPEKFITIDWNKEPYLANQDRFFQLQDACSATDLTLILRDSLETNLELTDLLFIDSFHSYEHLLLELMKHSEQVQKFIMIHDTETHFCPGMFNAVEDFLMDNPQWDLQSRNKQGPGMAILIRRSCTPIFRYSQAFVRTLTVEIELQKRLYYNRVHQGGSANPDWKIYLDVQRERFANERRWPLTHKKSSITELLAG